MGDGYVRQSSGEIVSGNTVEASPLNAEFNQIQSAFHLSSGHSHDGTTGEGPKINLNTSTAGILGVSQGGINGIHKLNATTAPTATDDEDSDYAVGSQWIDTTNDRAYVCVDATATSAVWLYIGNTTGWQSLDATLTALAGVTVSADKLIYATGADTFSTTDLTSAGRALLDDANAAAQLVTLGLTATATEINVLDGITATVTELNYVDGVTSDIQAQIDGKSATGHTHTLSDVTDAGALASEDEITTSLIAAATLVTESDDIASNDNDTTIPTSAAVKDYVDSAVSAGAIADGDKGDIVVSSSGTVWSIDAGVIVNADINASAAIDASKIGGGAVSTTEYNYLNGVTSAIQTQLDTKITASSSASLTNKTFDANGTGNSLSNVEVDNFAASAIVTESEGLGSSDNDTSLPTTAAVKDYVDNNGGMAAASQAEQEAGSSTAVAVTPGRQHYHESAAKCWVKFNSSGTIADSYNTTSITDNGEGDWTVNIATDFSNANYAALVSGGMRWSSNSMINYSIADATGPTAGQLRIRAVGGGDHEWSTNKEDPTDPNAIYFVAFGDQ